MDEGNVDRGAALLFQGTGTPIFDLMERARGAISTRRGHVQLGHALFLSFENHKALSSIEGLKVSDRATRSPISGTYPPPSVQLPSCPEE